VTIIWTCLKLIISIIHRQARLNRTQFSPMLFRFPLPAVKSVENSQPAACCTSTSLTRQKCTQPCDPFPRLFRPSESLENGAATALHFIPATFWYFPSMHFASIYLDYLDQQNMLLSYHKIIWWTSSEPDSELPQGFSFVFVRKVGKLISLEISFLPGLKVA